MSTLAGLAFGFLAWFFLRYVLLGFYTVDQNERAVKSSFGRAHRVEGLTTLDSPLGDLLRADERERYAFPQLRVIGPGGPYFRWPWETVHKVSVATQTLNMAYDAEVEPMAVAAQAAHRTRA
jgi:regulator of protease activity HflC (stomatin/prohibitin superfamily)